MARAIRQIGLKLFRLLLQLITRAPAPGWRRGTRPLTLDGR
jgi:hypothetical protein